MITMYNNSSASQPPGDRRYERSLAEPPLPQVSVASVRARVFRAAASDGVAMSFAPLTHRTMIVVEVELTDGSIGRGETWANFPAWAWKERHATVHEGVAPLLVGQTFASPGEAYRHLLDRLAPLGRQWGAPGPMAQAISGADAALWEIALAYQGVPLRAWVARANGLDDVRELPVYGSSLGPTNIAETAQLCLSLGISRVKIKLGFGADKDRRNVLEAKETLGDGVELYGDANQAWTLREASDQVPSMVDMGLSWIEEPLRGDRLDELSILHSRTGALLATGENLYGTDAFRPYLESGAISILQPDLSKVGGVTPFLEIARLCAERNVTVNPHLYNGAVATQLTAQLALSTPNAELLEWDIRDNPLRRPVDSLLTANGTITPESLEAQTIDLDELADFEETL